MLFLFLELSSCTFTNQDLCYFIKIVNSFIPDAVPDIDEYNSTKATERLIMYILKFAIKQNPEMEEMIFNAMHQIKKINRLIELYNESLDELDFGYTLKRKCKSSTCPLDLPVGYDETRIFHYQSKKIKLN